MSFYIPETRGGVAGFRVERLYGMADGEAPETPELGPDGKDKVAAAYGTTIATVVDQHISEPTPSRLHWKAIRELEKTNDATDPVASGRKGIEAAVAGFDKWTRYLSPQTHQTTQQRRNRPPSQSVKTTYTQDRLAVVRLSSFTKGIADDINAQLVREQPRGIVLESARQRRRVDQRVEGAARALRAGQPAPLAPHGQEGRPDRDHRVARHPARPARRHPALRPGRRQERVGLGDRHLEPEGQPAGAHRRHPHLRQGRRPADDRPRGRRLGRRHPDHHPGPDQHLPRRRARPGLSRADLEARGRSLGPRARRSRGAPTATRSSSARSPSCAAAPR
jgi:hypothetical protein